MTGIPSLNGGLLVYMCSLDLLRGYETRPIIGHGTHTSHEFLEPFRKTLLKRRAPSTGLSVVHRRCNGELGPECTNSVISRNPNSWKQYFIGSRSSSDRIKKHAQDPFPRLITPESPHGKGWILVPASAYSRTHGYWNWGRH